MASIDGNTTFAQLWGMYPDLIKAEESENKTRRYLRTNKTTLFTWLYGGHLSVRVGYPFFHGRDNPDSWWNTPRDRVPGNNLNALICCCSGPHMVSASCGACISGRPEDKFVGICVRFGDNTSIQGCATCIYNSAEDSCGRPPQVLAQPSPPVIQGWLLMHSSDSSGRRQSQTGHIRPRGWS